MDYSYNENVVPPAKGGRKMKIIVFIVFLAIILCIAAFFIFFSAGWKIINYVYPTVNLTLKISGGEISKVNNAKEKVIFNYGDKIAEGEGIIAVPRSIIKVKFPPSFPDSTALGHSDAQRSIIFDTDEMYVEDPYDSTYCAAKDSAADKDILNWLKAISPRKLAAWVSNSAKDFKITSQGGSKIMQSDILPAGFAGDLGIKDYANAKFTAYISTDSYLPVGFVAEFDDSSGKRNKIDASFSEYNENNGFVETPLANKFGDFIARESVYLRTDPKGSHDYLWPLWEQDHFGCQQCVNKIWDEDEDGLSNVREFVFGSDPLNKDSNSNGTNDYDELSKRQNPTSSKPLLDPYNSAFTSIMKYSLHAIEVGSNSAEAQKEKPVVRDAIVQSEIAVPYNAKSVTFKYEYEDEEELSYMTVFFDNNLLYKTTAIAGQKIDENDTSGANERRAIFPIDKFAGKKGTISFILNSVGDVSKQADFMMDFKTLQFLSTAGY